MPAVVATEEQKKALQLMRMATLARNDPWTFLTNFVYTHDEKAKPGDPDDPSIKPFPEKLFYRVIVRLWEEKPRLFIYKTRQIMMSWLFAALNLWDVLFHDYRRIAFQCREDDSASKLVKRARFIYTQLIKRGFPGLPTPRVHNGKIGTDSAIETIDKRKEVISAIYAVPKGAHVFRSEVFSDVLADELPHQDFGQESYEAASPAAAKYVGVGTPSNKASFAYKIMFGIDLRTGAEVGKRVVDSYDIRRRRYTEEQLLGMSREQFYAIPIEEIVACIPDMRYWEMRTGENTFPVLMVLHGADPDKRPGTPKGDAWIKSERAKCSSEGMWQREYRGKWDTHEGKPIVTNWNEAVSVNAEKAEFVPGPTVAVGIDYGTDVCGGLFGQMIMLPKYNFQQLHIFDEVILKNSNTIAMADEMKRKFRERYPEAWHDRNRGIILHPDPYQGNRKSSTTSDKKRNTDNKIMRAAGFRLHVKGFGVPETLDFADTVFFMTSPMGDPAVVIHPRCEYLIECLSGGWHYRKDFSGHKRYDVVEPNEWIHGGDMFRYLIANMFDIAALMKSKNQEEEIPIDPIIKVRHPVTGSPLLFRRKRKPRWHDANVW